MVPPSEYEGGVADAPVDRGAASAAPTSPVVSATTAATAPAAARPGLRDRSRAAGGMWYRLLFRTLRIVFERHLGVDVLYPYG